MIGNRSTRIAGRLSGGYTAAAADGGTRRFADLADTNAEIVELAALDGHRRAIADLAASARESNVFFEPVVLDAAMKEERRSDRLKLVLVWQDRGRSALAGMLPLRIARHHWGPGRTVAFGWKHEFGIRGTPLIAPGQAQLFWAYAFDAIRRSTLPRYLILPALADGGDCHHGLRAAALTTSRRTHIIGRETHVTMKADCDGEAYLQRTMSARRYKRMVKNRRDLQERGELESRVFTEQGDVMVAFRRFVELEASGWKGRSDGAMLQKPDGLRFFLRTVCDFAAEGRVRFDSLDLDGEPIGMSIVVISGDTAFCWKTSFDERFAKYSPGMLTVMDVTRGIADDPRITFADSCTETGHPMMSRLWADTADAVDILIDIEPKSITISFRLAVAAETIRRRGRAIAKKAYHTVRNRLRAWRGAASSARN